MDVKKLRTVGAAVCFVAFLGVARIVVAGSAPAAHQPVTREQAIYLIRATLLRLDDANHSGNYTVFRDLATPTFRAAHTDANLARTFEELRLRGIDLSVVAVLAPHPVAAPTINRQGQLELSGFFDTRPLRIQFSLAFEDIAGKWRLAAISVATPAAPPQAVRKRQP